MKHPFMQALKNTHLGFDAEYDERNKTEFFSDDISFKLKNLELLDTKCDSSSLSEDEASDDAIIYLDLNWKRQQLQQIPLDQMQLWTNLRILNVSYNQITELPIGLFYFEFLEQLHLEGNRLTAIPKQIKELRRLRLLSLSENALLTIPNELCFLTSLFYLRLGSVYGGNLLSSLPDNIGSLTSLRELDVSHNRICSLPDGIGCLKYLSHLKCYANRLQFIPASVSNLCSLVSLDLGSNQLTQIPHEVSRLASQLQYLNLHNNQLQVLPEEFSLMIHTSIVLSGNPFTMSVARSRRNPLPSLKELAARTVLKESVKMCCKSVPIDILSYLNVTRSCSQCSTPIISTCISDVFHHKFRGHKVASCRSLCSTSCLDKCISIASKDLQW